MISGLVASTSREAGVGSPFEVEYCDPAAADAAGIIAAGALTIGTPVKYGAVESTDTPLSGQPDVERGLTLNVTGLTNVGSVQVDVYCKVWNAPDGQEETHLRIVGTSVTTFTTKITVQRNSIVRVIAEAIGAAGGTATFTLGWADVWSTNHRIGHDSDVLDVYKDCIRQSEYTVNVPESSITGVSAGGNIRIQGKSTYGVVDGGPFFGV